uniref:Neuropeptide VF precursor n=1 Tax=Naja naja TaxID=35670 RepID=A0A8C6Y060_NAJNA
MSPCPSKVTVIITLSLGAHFHATYESDFFAIFLIISNCVICFPFQSNEDLIEEKQRSVNLEELKDWELKNIVKMSGSAGKVVPSSMANLPLRFGRNFLERRNIKPTANLPLRFGRKTPSVQRFFHSLANLPEKFGRSFLFSLIQGTQDCDQIKNSFNVQTNRILYWPSVIGHTRNLSWCKCSKYT